LTPSLLKMTYWKLSTRLWRKIYIHLYPFIRNSPPSLEEMTCSQAIILGGSEGHWGFPTHFLGFLHPPHKYFQSVSGCGFQITCWGPHLPGFISTINSVLAFCASFISNNLIRSCEEEIHVIRNWKRHRMNRWEVNTMPALDLLCRSRLPQNNWSSQLLIDLEHIYRR
jgi:hypothetical protein